MEVSREKAFSVWLLACYDGIGGKAGGSSPKQGKMHNAVAQSDFQAAAPAVPMSQILSLSSLLALPIKVGCLPFYAISVMHVGAENITPT